MSRDAIDLAVGIEEDSTLDVVRKAREAARTNSQAAHDALFAPTDDGGFTLTERLAVASFVIDLHRAPGDHLAVLAAGVNTELAAADADVAAAVAAAAAAARRPGPYGVYREPGLAGESDPGIAYEAPAELGPRLAAALTHAALLVQRPRESSPQALQLLIDAGWTTAQIVTLSQLVSFLAYQVRVVHGLSVLKESA